MPPKLLLSSAAVQKAWLSAPPFPFCEVTPGDNPLVETRIPFELDVVELNNVVRGAKDVDLGRLEAAAKKIALFEEKIVYHGLPE